MNNYGLSANILHRECETRSFVVLIGILQLDHNCIFCIAISPGSPGPLVKRITHPFFMKFLHLPKARDCPHVWMLVNLGVMVRAEKHEILGPIPLTHRQLIIPTRAIIAS